MNDLKPISFGNNDSFKSCGSSIIQAHPDDLKYLIILCPQDGEEDEASDREKEQDSDESDDDDSDQTTKNGRCVLISASLLAFCVQDLKSVYLSHQNYPMYFVLKVGALLIQLNSELYRSSNIKGPGLGFQCNIQCSFAE